MVVEFEISRQGKDIKVLAQNLSTEKNYNTACSHLKKLQQGSDLKELTEKAIKDSKDADSSHLGIIKIYKNTRGNFTITKAKENNNLIFTSNCTLHDEN